MIRRIGYLVLLAVLVVTLGFGFAPAPRALAAGNSVPLAESEAAYVPGQLVIGFAPSSSLGSIASRAGEVAQAVGAKVLKTDDQGMALIDVGTHRDLQALALTLKRIQGVRYAEPNYIYKAGEQIAESGIQVNQAMAAPPTATLSSTYPNDPDVLTNVGWKNVTADIVWKNTAPSKTVCLLDTGVDYLHPDLKGKIIKGPDYVSDDSNPMDDYGRGTHLAGIIAAVANNKEGIVGVSTGKVLAVKVLDSNGTGEIYDIVQGIKYCANQASVSILSVAWGGTASQTLSDAIYYATATKGKLVVAAAGDNNTSSVTSNYPAAYSTSFSGVVAVAASGDGNSPVNYTCKATTSNYGNWITLAAPGTSIYSTTPWDKAFTMSFAKLGRYYYWSGTAQAAAFVSAAAARVWGYLPGDTAAQVATRLRDKGNGLSINGTCWPSSMPPNLRMINLARAMDRGAIQVSVKDAVTYLPVAGAKVTIYTSTNAVVGSGVIPSGPTIDERSGDVIFYPNSVDIINLPATYSPDALTAKVSAVNYTASPQNAFLGSDALQVNPDGTFPLTPGTFSVAIVAFMPPKSANFAVVGLSIIPGYFPGLGVWVPSQTPPGPNKFIVAENSYTEGPSLVLPHGSLITDPYARWMNSDYTYYQSIFIHNRTSNSKAPWYIGPYWVGITDGLTSGTNHLDGYNVSAIAWKDGAIKARVDKGTNTCGAGSHWWYPLQIISPASGAATYVKTPAHCGTINDAPYHP